MLLGIKDSTGLGNNADEIKTASILFDNTIIRPFQELLIEHFDRLLAYNNIALNLYFITLQPLEFTEIDEDVQDQETIEEETGVKQESLSEDHREMTPEESEDILGSLKDSGEVMSDEYELVDEIDEDPNIDPEEWANSLIREKKSTLSKIREYVGLVGSSEDNVGSLRNGSAFSYLDSKNGLYKIRYKYAIGSRKPMKDGNKSRDFCTQMMKLSGRNIVWRIEDIDKASFRERVNVEFRHKGKPYDIFKFKGGIYCRHKWVRVLYRLKKGSEVNENLTDYTKATKKEFPSYMKNKTPRGTKESVIAPENMKNRGAYPK
jgi:hypothetical protein